MRYYHRFFTLKEAYRAVENAVRSMKDFKRAMNKGVMDDVLKEKIMLEVTEVNGCEMCHVFHTKEAEKLGIHKAEFSGVAIGVVSMATSDEDRALAFARHYAEMDGAYSNEEWTNLISCYGTEGAKGILGAIRIITVGNVYGIASGALLSRLKFQPVKGSRFANELAVTLSILVFLPLALIRSLFR